MVEMFESRLRVLLPKEPDFQIEKLDVGDNEESFRATIRLPCRTKDELLSWKSNFESCSSTKWITRGTALNSSSEFLEYYVCHYSSFNKTRNRKFEAVRIKNTQCSAKMRFRIKNITKNTYKKDLFIRRGLPTVVVIDWCHNHSTHFSETYSFRRADDGQRTAPNKSVLLERPKRSTESLELNEKMEIRPSKKLATLNIWEKLTESHSQIPATLTNCEQLAESQSVIGSFETNSELRPKKGIYCRRCNCRIVCYSAESYEDHWQKKHPDVDRSEMYAGGDFQCPYCPFRFKSQQALTSHHSHAHLLKFTGEREHETFHNNEMRNPTSSQCSSLLAGGFFKIFVEPKKEITEEDLVMTMDKDVSEKELSTWDNETGNVGAITLPIVSGVFSLNVKQEIDEDAFPRLSPSRLTCHIDSLSD